MVLRPTAPTNVERAQLSLQRVAANSACSVQRSPSAGYAFKSRTTLTTSTHHA